jgi:hypothetical protein
MKSFVSGRALRNLVVGVMTAASTAYCGGSSGPDTQSGSGTSSGSTPSGGTAGTGSNSGSASGTSGSLTGNGTGGSGAAGSGSTGTSSGSTSGATGSSTGSGTGSSGSANGDGGTPTQDAAAEGSLPTGDGGAYKSRYVFSVTGTKTYLNGHEVLAKGLRASNALLSDQSVTDLIAQFDNYMTYGINIVSVYFMGSRYGNIPGYRQDASLDPVYTARMGRIIEAADARGIIVLVGCLYWGTTTAKWSNWTQQQADTAVSNTTIWGASHNYRNVFYDPDNEGMAIQGSTNIKNLPELVQAGKNGDPKAMMASPYQACAAAADLCIHLSQVDPAKPYIQSEGGGIWVYGTGNYQASAIGVYTSAQEQTIITDAQNAYQAGKGWMISSMWLQAPPPYGPHADFGGDGLTLATAGVAWWMNWLKANEGGAYVPPPPLP